MRRLYAHVKDIQPLSEIPPNAILLWENDSFAVYYVYDIYSYEVQWILVNKTSSTKYVSLLRGAVLNINGQTYNIPNYIFGNAFADVYFDNDLSSYVSNLNEIPLYSLAVLKDSSNKSIVGFVFVLPPNGVINVPEYGFEGLQSLEAELEEVSPENMNLYAIIYDYAEIIEYEEEAGISVQAPPDPYAVFSYQFKINNIGEVMTPRVIIEIPQSDVNIVTTIIDDIKKFFRRL